ncbi:MAG: cytochrome c biogenesis protein CcsA [Campylobacterota bacterium]|nr:cytochrome c biogenesis protein CcsA [Campylobacterota bacterium]
MIKTVMNIISSMQLAVTLMLIFAISIGYATFIENDFGTQSSKALVYNALWFEILLALLAFNLLLNIVKFKMFSKKKWLVFTFHAAFLVVLFGAAVTRFLGFEGTMHIREGDISSQMISTDNFITCTIGSTTKEEKVILSPLVSNKFETHIDGVDIKLKEYISNAAYEIVEDEKSGAILNMMVSDSNGARVVQLLQGESLVADDIVLDFDSNKSYDKDVVSIRIQDGKLVLNTPISLNTLFMDTKKSGEIEVGENLFNTRVLYSSPKSNFVLKAFYPHAKQELVSTYQKSKMGNGTDALIFELSDASTKKEVTVFGSAGSINNLERVSFSGKIVNLSYGAKFIKLPFAIKLVDFEMQRYPGSNSPSSYASDVILIDKQEGINEPFKIYMNHILEHRGYRFFQASYDQDEKGTVLSVNHDPGTLPTYIGYALLAFGMFGALFMRGGRFEALSKKAKKAASAQTLPLLALILALIYPLHVEASSAQGIVKTVTSFDELHAKKFGELVVQDSSGRMKPVDTLTSEILNKINRGNSVANLTSNQIILGMMIRPDAWKEINLIRTANRSLNKLIGVDENAKTAAFSQFFEYPNQLQGYKLSDAVSEATRKNPAKRDKFDKAVLQVDERVNIAYMVFSGSLIRIWPKPSDANNKWFATIDAMEEFEPQNSEIVRDLAVSYFTAVDEAISSGSWDKATASLSKIAQYQRFYGVSVIPSKSKVEVEIFYNHLNVFEKLWPLYFIIGFILLILSFVKILKPKFSLEKYSKTTLYLLVLFFIAHSAGLAMRWYISGHAPWSDGYESMIYIAWATVLAGFIFSKNSPITIASTAILAGLILFVAHLNWMNPQVTNLVPVLQSYWLSIHVSMITASYGFLGLGALLGFITLILFILKNSNNSKHITLSIKELNAINEMSLMAGLVLLTVGNFLGGVWANESWGRYWGWDPKETWALVTILVYAVVVHLRFIKSFYSEFTYSAVSLLSFTSVLMTYFGVNYYLAGLHSYAKGDPIPVPDFVPITYAIIFIIIALAFRNRSIEK